MQIYGDGGGAGPHMPDSWRRSLDASMSSLQMQVTPENVLEVRRILLTESDRMRASVDRARLSRGGLCGGDPVSRDARAAFGERVAVLIEQARQYAEELGHAARSLDQIARSYGMTDQQIAASYHRLDPGSRA